MLDHDLARLYGIEVRQLKRQVRRNADRFPPDFMFILTPEEHAILRCQFGTLRWGAHPKYLPDTFTELGVAMLSSVISSREAVEGCSILRRMLGDEEMTEHSPANAHVCWRH